MCCCDSDDEFDTTPTPAVDDTHNEDINGARTSSTVSVQNLDSGGSAGSFVFASEGDAGPAGVGVGSVALGGAGTIALMHGLPDLVPDSTAHCKT